MNFESLFSGKNVLITGGLGFIGSNLAIKLRSLGANINVVDSMIPEYGGNFFNVDNVKDEIKINISDVRDQHSMKYLVQSQDYIFNLAGQTSHMDSMAHPFVDLDINAKAQLSLLEVCRHYNPEVKVVFASTRQIYGRPDYLPVDEKHLIHPVDVNGINKVAGEWYHILYNNVYGIKACALRLTNTYGPRMRIKDARQTFLGIWVKKLLLGQPIEVWGGEQLRDFNYVDDVVNALLIAGGDVGSSAGKVFNLGSSEVVSLKFLAEEMIEVNQGGDLIVKKFPRDRKKIDIGDYYSNYSLIKDTLGWQPETSLRQGLEQTISYYREFYEEYL